MKFSEVLQYSDGLSNKVSNIIRRHIDNMKLLQIYILLLSLSYSYVLFFINAYMAVFLFNTVIYVFSLLLYVYISSSCQLALFSYPD